MSANKPAHNLRPPLADVSKLTDLELACLIGDAEFHAAARERQRRIVQAAEPVSDTTDSFPRLLRRREPSALPTLQRPSLLRKLRDAVREHFIPIWPK